MAMRFVPMQVQVFCGYISIERTGAIHLTCRFTHVFGSFYNIAARNWTQTQVFTARMQTLIQIEIVGLAVAVSNFTAANLTMDGLSLKCPLVLRLMKPNSALKVIKDPNLINYGVSGNKKLMNKTWSGW
jgi:hypothetical protein